MTPDLTPRQRQVLALVWDGMTHRMIARRLGIMPHTVDNTLNDARRRVDVDSTIELLRWWLEHPGFPSVWGPLPSTVAWGASASWTVGYHAGPSDPDRLPGATTGGPA